ncbi:hypothetical protein [Methanobacterium spitsbergense]|uniref:Uncharacterized protein n=1 Tax=Methanobacterium spitsbergense TaxID=2874285 RepID=A0A8T5UZX7_9EURY|nr:hypothetical protein [Methanobacterium spitsbergense]MBZ2166279.1 hypothetical protein [Methanobacterium spitsbergense]
MDLISLIQRLLYFLKPEKLDPSNTKIYNEFLRIHNIPYNEQSYNCTHKTNDFAKYLINLGVKNLSTLNIGYKDGKYNHIFLVWNEMAFDPTNQDITYNIPLTDYLGALYKIGFTGMRIKSPIN